VCAALLLPASTGLAQPSQDAGVARGIKQVDDGEYDAAIITLDGAARRLAQDPQKVRDVSLAYLYLGIAYIGKGQEAAARARFREALQQAGDLTLSPEKFPPKVINAFEAARDEIKAAGPPKAAASPTAPAKKGGSGKWILIGGVVAAGAGGAALAAGGGGGSSSPSRTTTTPTETRTALQFSGTLASQEQRFYTFVASKAGTAEVKLGWQDNQLQLSIDCQEEAPPYSGCNGQFNRTTNTTAQYTAAVQQKTYLIIVSNYSSRAGAEPFTVQILHP
jgi:hypothetical protein